ncbi:putative karyopherin-like protein [Erysiphe necator]|uniref:Putative karyopherin-like protein n=1 Tax=Uncinula necator TaxID=52586 RepID=A0A0B1NW94_UNCNE|nr:putative karyopherin-like protein [Erysiphe necator]
MDQQRFLELLKEVQIPNTQRVKAATSELRKNYYTQPESLLYLLHFLTSNEASEIRQLAAVGATRLVDQHWSTLNDEQKSTFRERLLQCVLEEQKSTIRNLLSRVVAAIANLDFKQGQWTQLPSWLAQAATSEKTRHRETGLYIIYTLLEDAFEIFEDKLPDLFQLLNTTIKDPESAEARINSLLCLSWVAIMLEPDEHKASFDCFNDIFPQMVNVLKVAIQEDHEGHIMQAFEVFQTLLSCEPSLLNKHFKDLLNFMIEISSNTNISSETRCQALSFLMQATKFRKMKIQGLKDMGETITLKSMQIASEIDDTLPEDDDDVTPSKSALGLLDLLASSLPPRQVIIPLLKVLPEYVKNSNPKYRQAGILALGMCVEGAPDFICSQLDTLMPSILQLLHDSDISVRRAALNGVSRLADDLAEDLSKHHEQLIPILLKNLDSAGCLSDSSEAEVSKNLDILKSSCGAIDSVCRGISKISIRNYITELVPRLGNLLSHSDLTVKSSAAGALGSIAESSEDAFLPYFETSMGALSQFLSIKDTSEELDLRGVVCDAVGCIATAVGPEVFKPYVNILMQTSEENLHLDHPRLRETSYILWSTFAKLYEADFSPFLEGVVKSIFKSLTQDESELSGELGEGKQELLGQKVIVSDNKVQFSPKSNFDTEIDNMDDDNESDWDDDFANTAVAMEKEVAIEVLGDVMSHTRRNFMPYFEQAVKITLDLIEHGYDGLRKGAIGTLWRSYACLWALMEDETGEKWTPGLPLKQKPSGELLKLGELVTTATVSLWEDETNRAVVTDINRNVAATLKLCGPAILTQKDFTEKTITICTALITKLHPCQRDLGDDADNSGLADEESSEYDWLVIDTAFDVIISLSKAIGSQFGELWKIFQKPIMKFASSQVNYERSAAVGVIAECIGNMGDSVTPYTKTLLTLLLHRLDDEDGETKSNAAFAIGQLVFHSTASSEYLSAFTTIFNKLEPLLNTQHSRSKDNAVGCICRMIMSEIDHVPIQEVLPAIIDLLPLKEDYEENSPLFDCISGLYNQAHPLILSQTAKLIPIFASVLGEPYNQLESPTRSKIIASIKFIAEKDPTLVHGNENLVKVLQENINQVSV